jgi:hypothetical protein
MVMAFYMCQMKFTTTDILRITLEGLTDAEADKVSYWADWAELNGKSFHTLG